jgi:K+-transporting ATPase A subunit
MFQSEIFWFFGFEARDFGFIHMCLHILLFPNLGSKLINWELTFQNLIFFENKSFWNLSSQIVLHSKISEVTFQNLKFFEKNATSECNSQKMRFCVFGSYNPNN